MKNRKFINENYFNLNKKTMNTSRSKHNAIYFEHVQRFLNVLYRQKRRKKKQFNGTCPL